MSASVLAVSSAVAAVLWSRFARGARTRARLVSAPSAGPSGRRLRASTRAAQALTVDLVAAAVAAGVPLAGALEAAAAGSPSDAAACSRAAAALRLGADPVVAVGAEPGLQAMARCLLRASAHGATAAQLLEQLAADLRAEAAFAAAERARRAGVHVVAPLVVCFLPAFVLVGVAPVILALGSSVAS